MRPGQIPAVSVGLTYDRSPDPSWTAALERITPSSLCLSHLRILWEPGDPWEPIERWVIWHCRPRSLIARSRPDVLEELEGPHPRSTGAYDPRQGQWVGGPCFQIDRMQWELYQQTGCYGTRWWIVQGDRGGHRYRFSPVEARLSRLKGGPSEPPAPGALPYAEPDRRTWAMIAEQDKLRKYAMITDFLHRRPADFDAEERAEAEAAADELWRWLERQMGACVDELQPVLRESVRDVPRLRADQRAALRRQQIATQGDYDEARERFVREVAGTAA